MVRIGIDTQIGGRGYLNWAAAWPCVLTPSLRRIADTWWSTSSWIRRAVPPSRRYRGGGGQRARSSISRW
jgi:hypothetical protein